MYSIVCKFFFLVWFKVAIPFSYFLVSKLKFAIAQDFQCETRILMPLFLVLQEGKVGSSINLKGMEKVNDGILCFIPPIFVTIIVVRLMYVLYWVRKPNRSLRTDNLRTLIVLGSGNRIFIKGYCLMSIGLRYGIGL